MRRICGLSWNHYKRRKNEVKRRKEEKLAKGRCVSLSRLFRSQWGKMTPDVILLKTYMLDSVEDDLNDEGKGNKDEGKDGRGQWIRSHVRTRPICCRIGSFPPG